MTLKLSNKVRNKKSSFEPNPLVDLEIPTLMITKAEAYKCFFVGVTIGLGVLYILYISFGK